MPPTIDAITIDAITTAAITLVVRNPVKPALDANAPEPPSSSDNTASSTCLKNGACFFTLSASNLNAKRISGTNPIP